MTPQDLLHTVLDAAIDELVCLTDGSQTSRDDAWYVLELHLAWLAAGQDAQDAYDHWAQHPGPMPFAAYRAAADRADTAQDHLAAATTARTDTTRFPALRRS